ncbi:MAG TPA: FGGY-family carbohydrate kinase, partial [Deltaproteobacteria bacterium]|nr:FGGY-family carbohydrate kinase [Deltaproteobacteria bacterium]
PPGSRGVVVTPWLNGERTPVDDMHVRAGIHNLSTTTTAEDIVRAFLEGVALNTRWSLKYVERFVGRRLDPLTIVGGGASSDVWCRIFADCLGRGLRRPPEPIRANARGAAFIAAVALKDITFSDIPSLMEYERVFEPGREASRIYDELFDAFVDIYRQNRGLYRALNG